tara:strand:- start:273 stop:434 length:162 start_codon:yes stop_codon:yes gene_type:complete
MTFLIYKKKLYSTILWLTYSLQLETINAATVRKAIDIKPPITISVTGISIYIF